MRASTILFLVFCAWFYVFQMTPVRPVNSSPIFCGTVSKTDNFSHGYVPPSEDQMRGKLAFDANCARCHNTALEKKSTGPALMGVASRIPAGDWIYDWVHNPGKMIASKDPYALKVWEANGKAAMDPFPHLTNQDIDDIMAWINGYDEY